MRSEAYSYATISPTFLDEMLIVRVPLASIAVDVYNCEWKYIFNSMREVT